MGWWTWGYDDHEHNEACWATGCGDDENDDEADDDDDDGTGGYANDDEDWEE